MTVGSSPSYTALTAQRDLDAGATAPFVSQYREPRCRVCQDEFVRLEVNRLLAWHGVPLGFGTDRLRPVTYTQILRWLEPINTQRTPDNQISYDSLWVHAKRHYRLGIVDRKFARLEHDLRKAFGVRATPDEESSVTKVNKYEQSEDELTHRKPARFPTEGDSRDLIDLAIRSVFSESSEV